MRGKQVERMNDQPNEAALLSMKIDLLERELEEIERRLNRTSVQGISKHRLLQDKADCKETLAGLV